jgi:hypothetical protein
MSGKDRSKDPNFVLNAATGRYVKIGGKIHRKIVAEQEKRLNPATPLEQKIDNPEKPKVPKKRPPTKVPKMKVPVRAPPRPSEDAPERQGQVRLLADGTSFNHPASQNYLQFGT